MQLPCYTLIAEEHELFANLLDAEIARLTAELFANLLDAEIARLTAELSTLENTRLPDFPRIERTRARLIWLRSVREEL